MSSFGFGANIGSSIRENFRKKNYENFVGMLMTNNYFNEINVADIEAMPLCIYRNPFSISKTYCIVCPNVIFFDLNPSTSNQNLARIGILSKNTIQHFESRDATMWEKFSIMEAMEMLDIVFVHQAQREMKFRIFAEEPGQKSLTQDIGNTVRIGLRLKKIIEK
jgi:hypothetical protein